MWLGTHDSFSPYGVLLRCDSLNHGGAFPHMVRLVHSPRCSHGPRLARFMRCPPEVRLALLRQCSLVCRLARVLRCFSSSTIRSRTPMPSKSSAHSTVQVIFRIRRLALGNMVLSSVATRSRYTVLSAATTRSLLSTLSATTTRSRVRRSPRWRLTRTHRRCLLGRFVLLRWLPSSIATRSRSSALSDKLARSIGLVLSCVTTRSYLTVLSPRSARSGHAVLSAATTAAANWVVR